MFGKQHDIFALINKEKPEQNIDNAERPEPKKKKKRKTPLKLILTIILVMIILIGCLGVGFIMLCLSDTPDFDADNLPSFKLSSYIYDDSGNMITKIHGLEDRTYVEIEDIPQVVLDAFVYTEDARFYDHFGIDIIRVFGAMVANFKSGRISEGASTITMQVAQNLFLPDQKTDTTYKRKIQEAYLALKLEQNFDKNEILEMYLNIIYFGEGAYGIESAAETYFGKSVSEISTVQEAALLAGLPNGPSIYDPFVNPEQAKERRDLVIDNMVRYGVLDEASATEAKNADLGIDNESSSSDYPYPYFIESVITQMIDEYGEDTVYNGGLQIYTTLNTQAQTIAEEAMANNDNFPDTAYDDDGNKQPEGATVVMDPATGYVKALVGGREHLQLMQFNRTTQAYRQPGSSIKPIIAYAPAIELLGWGSGTVLIDQEITYGDWSPSNSDGYFRGPVTLRTALESSINTIAVQTIEQLDKQLGLKRVLQFAEDMGITSLDEVNDANYSAALGGLYNGVNLLEMAGAYGTFANNGIYHQPILVTSVKSEALGIDKTYTSESYRTISETTAYIITDMLQDVVNYGTATRADIGREMAGKTGTTDSGRDLWFCGYTPDLVGIVWIGYDLPEEMPNSYGSTYPTLVWREIMSQLLEDTEESYFQEPDGIEYCTVCSRTGLLPGAYCYDTTTEIYATGTAPTETCSAHATVTICKDSGLLAGSYCTNTSIVSADSSDIPTQVCDGKHSTTAKN